MTFMNSNDNNLNNNYYTTYINKYISIQYCSNKHSLDIVKHHDVVGRKWRVKLLCDFIVTPREYRRYRSRLQQVNSILLGERGN